MSTLPGSIPVGTPVAAATAAAAPPRTSAPSPVSPDFAATLAAAIASLDQSLTASLAAGTDAPASGTALSDVLAAPGSDPLGLDNLLLQLAQAGGVGSRAAEAQLLGAVSAAADGGGSGLGTALDALLAAPTPPGAG